MEDCEQLCNAEQDCIYWWWLKRTKTCATYAMEFRNKKNTAAGKKHCQSNCFGTTKPITCDDGWIADDVSGRNIGCQSKALLKTLSDCKKKDMIHL